jgi:DNA-binding NtrC family response regulator
VTVPTQQRAAILREYVRIAQSGRQHFPLPVGAPLFSRASSSLQAASPTLTKKPILEEKEIIEAALAETRGRVSGPAGAAAKLGVPSTTLESKIKSLKINKHRFKAI